MPSLNHQTESVESPPAPRLAKGDPLSDRILSGKPSSRNAPSKMGNTPPTFVDANAVHRSSIRLLLTGKQLRQHIAAYVAGWNKEPRPFIWTKPAAAIIQSHRRMIARIS